AVKVLDGRLVAPGDLVAREAEDRSDAIAVLRARRPTAERDRYHTLLVHVRALRQLPRVNPRLGAKLLDAFEGVRHDHRLRCDREAGPQDRPSSSPGESIPNLDLTNRDTRPGVTGLHAPRKQTLGK